MELSGEIRPDPEDPAPSRATVHVTVQQTSAADGPAREVARLDLDGVMVRAGDPPLTFVLDAPDLDPDERHEVRVHADVSGDGRVAPGDQVSVESVPVLTRGAPDRVAVTLRRVT